MKTMKFFKKPALLLSIVVIAVLLAIAATATLGFIYNEENSADYGEKYSAVQVSTSGKVSLKFYYSTVGTATGFVAEVTDPVTKQVETQEFDVDDLVTTGNGVCVPVVLAPSEMTHTVTVYAVGAEGASTKTLSYSVYDYACDVIADASMSEYHGAMRALLNWGARAQLYFGDATAVRADVGLFNRNSNSIHGLNTITYTKGSVTPGTKITGDEMKLSLEPGNIVMHFYINYSGDDDLVATVSRDGIDPVETSVLETGEKGVYLIRVANVPANMFNTPYTITVSEANGNDVFTATKSVREYLGVLLGKCNSDNNRLDEGNVVRTLYQLYQLVTGDTGAESCKHSGAGNFYYWVTDGDNTSSVRCNMCHTLFGTNISNDVNAYAPAGTIKHSTVTGSVDKTIMTEDGVNFLRLDNFYSNRDNWGDIGLTGLFTGKTGVSGQYIVIKYRVSAEGNGTSNIQIYANTNKTSGMMNLVAEGQANFVKNNDNMWHTVIVNLADRVSKPGVTFVDEGDGTYDVRYLSLRLFTGGTAAKLDVSDPGRYTYSYSYTGADSKTAWESFYGTPLTEEELAAKVERYPDYKLAKVGKQNVSETAYVDLAFIALCDSLDEAKTLVDSDEYEWSISNSLSAYRNVADDTCSRHVDKLEKTANEDGSTTYEYKCQACGHVHASQTVPANINAFWPSYDFGKFSNGGVSSYDFAYDGDTMYRRYKYEAGKAGYITVHGGDGNGNVSSVLADTGRYAVIKYRANDTANTVTFGATTNTADASNAYKYFASTTRSVANLSSGWEIAVVDLMTNSPYNPEKGTGYQCDIENSKVQLRFTVNGVSSFDISYVAIVDDIEEARSLVDMETFRVLDKWQSKGSLINTATGLCMGTHQYDRVAADNDRQYVMQCVRCRKTLDVDFYSESAGKATNSGTTTLEMKYDEEGGFWYNELKHLDSGSGYFDFFTTNPDNRAGSYTASAYHAGRYLVFKFRSETTTSIQLAIGTHDHHGGKWNPVNSSLGGITVDNKSSKWQVAILDLEGLANYTVGAEETLHFGSAYNTDPTSNGGGGTVSPGAHIDIAYAAIVSDLDDIKQFVTDEEVLFYGNNIHNIPTPRKTENPKVCIEHTISGTPLQRVTESGITEHYYVCKNCTAELSIHEVSSDINWYATIGAFGAYGTSLNKVLYDDANDIAFNRFTASGGYHFNISSSSGGAGNWTSQTYNTGSYIIIKYRSTSTGATFNIGTSDFGKYTSGSSKDQPKRTEIATLPATGTSTEDFVWKVMICEIPSDFATYTINSNQQIYCMIGGSARTVDVAYVAVADSLEEAKSLMEPGENYYNKYGYEVSGHDDICIQHLSTETVDNLTYTYTCQHCKQIVDTVTISEAVTKYYSAKGFGSTASQYYNANTACPIIVENGVSFARSEKNLQILWGRVAADFKGSGQSVLEKTFDVGNAKYFVIKTRYADAAGEFSVSFSTTAKNGTDTTYGYTSVTIIPKDQADGEWHTFVIDLETLLGEYYGKDANTDTYVLDTYYYSMNGKLDVSYVAFVEDDWSGIAELTGEATVRKITAKSGGTYQVVNTADGSVAE